MSREFVGVLCAGFDGMKSVCASLWFAPSIRGAALVFAAALGTTSVHPADVVVDVPKRVAVPTAMPWSPGNDAVVLQNPPDFSWPWSEHSGPWVIEFRKEGGPWQRAASARNALSLSAALAPGRYEWQVVTGKGQAVEPARRFTVPEEARKFVVPSPSEQLRRASERARPRFRIPLEARNAESADHVDKVIRMPWRPVDDASFERDRSVGDEASRRRAKRDAKRFGQMAASRLTEAALALQWDAASSFAPEARRRLLEAAAWDPSGSSGNDQGDHLVARDVLVGMALLYDALHGELSPRERSLVRERIIQRVDGFKREFLDGARMQRQPFNSHGWTAWASAAAAAALVAGEDARADALFLEIVPAFITSISPWGGAEGGYGNGTAYAVWDIAALILPLDVISQAIGIDLYGKPWLANVGRFLAYFLPPGAPAGSFGDGSEFRPERVGFWVLRALAQRTHDPVIAWAAGQAGPQSGGPASLILASMSAPLKEVALPPRTPNSKVLRDIGWVAMHSDLANKARVSVYFKSSPYGSHSHSHADQNSFVVHAGGRVLLTNSGYYDSYDSEHAREWYTTTRAHNAISFDGGKGQATRNRAAQGDIVAYRLGDDYAIAVGDATAAYMGQLTQAVRTLVYVRPGLIIVRDRLASETPRVWEWNFHADSRMKGDERSARIESGSQSLCVDLLHGPASRFEQRSDFAAPPRSKGKTADFPDQWHAAYVANERSLSSEFVVALRVGCRGEVPRIAREGTGWVVSAITDRGDRRVTLGANAVEVR